MQKAQMNEYDYYVLEFPNAEAELLSQNEEQFTISEYTLDVMDHSMENFKKGKVSKAINLSRFENV